MKYNFIFLLLISLLAACGGYSEKRNPLSPEQVQIADMVAVLKDDATKLEKSAPETLNESMDDFVAAIEKFHNYCLRFGSNTLEAHDAFDQVMFTEAQITQSPGLEANADFKSKWMELRDGRLKELATKLGYRPQR